MNLACGCYIEIVKPTSHCKYPTPRLTFCPLHRNARDLLSMLKLLVDYWEEDHPRSPALERAMKIIASAEGKPPKETTSAR